MSWLDRFRRNKKDTPDATPRGTDAPKPIAENVISKVFKLPSITIDEEGLLQDRASVSEHPERLTAEIRSMNFKKEDPADEKLRQAGRVRRFLEDSRPNWGPFRFAIAELLEKPGELEYALSEWDLEKPEELAKYNELHRLYFGCFSDAEMVGGVICAVQLNAGTIEIGGIAGTQKRGRGFGSSAVPSILANLAQFPAYREKIHTVISQTQKDNYAAQRMLEKCGFMKTKTGDEGLVYELAFDEIPMRKE